MTLSPAVSLLAVAIAFLLISLLPAFADDALPDCTHGASPAGSTNSSVSATLDPKPSDQLPVDGVDPDPAWQPPGGTVAFTLHSTSIALSGLRVAVCFGWGGANFTYSPHVWPVQSATNDVTYNVEIPPGLKPPAQGVTYKLFGFLVPLADMRIMVAGTGLSNTIDITRQIGITGPFLAAGFALLGVILAVLVFWRIAKLRKIAGSWFLWLISTPYGNASLSQLQVMLWTFVIGASAIYVMCLSGGLIEITDGTLVLLGIAGGATLAAQLHANQSGAADSAPPAVLPQLPGPVTGLILIGTPAPGEVRLGWNPPTTGGALAYYKVQFRQTVAAGAADQNWMQYSEQVTLPHCTIMGLVPANYDFQVLATNAAGDGPPPAPTPVVTNVAVPAQAATPAGGPSVVSGLQVDGAATVSEIPLKWQPATSPTRAWYNVAYRRHDSNEDWRPTSPVWATQMVLPGLQDGVSYDIKVNASNNGGNGQYGFVLTCTTQRNPKWSDLVISGEGAGQVDVTRVQMLFFTVITAIFVSLTVITSYTIPEIPSGFLILMGISNGVYVGSKFVPGS